MATPSAGTRFRRVRTAVTFLLALILAAGALMSVPAQALAVDWGTYLAQQWQGCEDTFAALDRDTGLTPWDGSASQPASGSGTAADPWLVGTPAELSWVMHNAPGAQKSLRLTADLDMGGRAKRAWAPATGFDTGTVLIDGAGHTVYNLYVTGAGGASNAPGLAFISSVNNPSFTMRDVTFRFCEVRSSGGYNQAVAVGYFVRGLVDNVGVEDSIVKGGNFVAGLLVGWDTGYAAVDGNGNKLDAPTGSFINRCRTVRVYTYGASCIGNFIAPLWGGTVTNSYAEGGVTISTGGHSGGFVSCPGYCYVENCFCNITMYGNTQTGVFNGVNHFNNAFVNCGASGVVEGTNQVGGFVGDATRGTSSAYPSQYTDCYSTTMVGMQSSANNMGGFVGSTDGNIRYTDCYAAGEVGALTTVGNSATVGGFMGANGGSVFTHCYFDKQTSAMDVRTADTDAGIRGLLTKEMTGPDALANLAGLSGDVWMAKDGVYPQLQRFANPAEFPADRRNNMRANSMASVCTAMLYPSNGDYEDTAYDSVRNITYVFPLTNDAMVNDPSFAVSWEADEIYSDVVGDHDVPVVVLDENTYEVKSLAPGVGWTTVRVVYTDPGTGEQTVGSRRLRLVPTTTLSLATSRGIDHVAYVAREGARPLPVNVDEGFVSYDHRLGVNFSTGNAIQLGNGQLKQEGFPAGCEDFTDVRLTEVGGVVDVAMDRQEEDGTWTELELTDDLKALLLRKRHTELRDLGHYRMRYKWYTSGNKNGAYLESVKYLDVIETFDVTYYRNDEDLEQPAKKDAAVEQVMFWRARGSSLRTALDGGAAPYYYDIGAYVPGDHVDPAYYPGSTAPAEGVPATPATDGWQFDGWNTAADGTGDGFDASTAINGSVKVYGQWSPKPVRVVFDLGGGTLTDPDDEDAVPTSGPIVQDKHALETVTPPAGTPVREGYSFMGWSTEEDALEPDYDPDERLWEEPDGTRTYHAVWVPNPVTAITAETRNATDPEAAHPQVGDDLVTTVTASNTGDPDSYWKDVDATVTLPDGVDLADEPVTVSYPDGTERTFDPKELFDAQTRTVRVPLGSVPGNSKVVMRLHTTVNGNALEKRPENPDDPDSPAVPPVQIPVGAAGSNPDGSPVPEETRETVPRGGDEDVLPDDPEPAVEKTVTDVTRGDAVDAQVGDILRYTVTVTNPVPYSLLKDARATDLLPAGIDLDRDSVRVTYADGTEAAMDPALVYDEATHTLTVPVGDVAGGDTVTVTFEGSIDRSVVDSETPGARDVGNVAVLDGDTPEDNEVPTERSSKVFPAGWIRFAVPEPSLSKTVVDDDAQDGFFEGDQVTYTIEVGNATAGTVWEDVVVHDTLPEGLSIVPTSLVLEHPDGTRERLARDLYDPETRELTVPVGDVAGGEVWRVLYSCDLLAPEGGGSVVNKASASGSGFGPTGSEEGGPQTGGTVAIDAAGEARIEAVRPEATLPDTGGSGTGGASVTTTTRTERTVRRVLRGLAVLPVTGDRMVDGAITLGACVTVAVVATVTVAVRRRTA